jgi:hypothetical protein
MDADIASERALNTGAGGPAVRVELSDLTLDDTLPELERVAKYATSAIALQRLVHVKLMATTAKEVGCVSAD